MIEIEAQNELTCARVGKLKSHLSKKNLQIKFVRDLWRFQNTYFLIKQSGKTSTIIVSVLYAFWHKGSLKTKQTVIHYSSQIEKACRKAIKIIALKKPLIRKGCW